MADKSKRMEVRLTSKHKKWIERAALLTGQSLTGFVLSTVLAKARETLEQERRIEAGLKERAAFLELLGRSDEPAPPPEKPTRRSTHRPRN